MKQWTQHAEERLSEYLNERTAREGLAGDDAAEFKEDLRSHIHEEAERSSAAAIGLMDLENIIGRLDAGYRPPVQATPGWRASPLRENAPKSRRIGGFFKWAFGVVVPAAVILFEMVASFCGSVFFDPVPTWWHAACHSILRRGGFGNRTAIQGS